MRFSFPTKLLSCLLTLVMVFTASGATTAAAADNNGGKYVKDVFIAYAYGDSEDPAKEWLTQHGYQPIADLNAGKTSATKTNTVAMLGITRTDDPSEAITDMAVMNMNGGYSFDKYEEIVKQKRADIDEFINTFIPALNEYRENYNGKGSEGGKKRAQMAHDLLNKFFDGDPEGDYAVNDTGKPLGDLFLNKTKQEIGNDAYNALSADQKLNTADFEQIILESSGPAVLMIEQILALATDTAEESWMDRLNGLSGRDLVKNIAEYVPSAKGKNLAPSAAMNLLAAHYEDYAKNLANDWKDVHDDILWYEQYCEEHNLVKDEEETGESYGSKLNEHFNKLKEADLDKYNDEIKRFTKVDSYYYLITEVSYTGEWGETLYELFRPEDESADYSKKTEYFAPIAAALSDGQRAALKFISLSTLLKLGADSDSVMEADFPSTDEMFKDSKGEKLETISIYSGINRAIFREGVALTNRAMVEKNMGNDPYGDIWDVGGMVDIISYTSLGVGTVSVIAGAAMASYASKALPGLRTAFEATKAPYQEALNAANAALEAERSLMKQGNLSAIVNPQRLAAQEGVYSAFKDAAKKFNDAKKAVQSMQKVSTAGKWLAGIGGALMIAFAILKGVQMYQYYHVEFSKIPIMIVDEADIVTTVKGDDGKDITLTNFDQFMYYDVVKCNRQEIGLSPSAQKNVDKYKEWNCGDAADINGDVGQEWVAMYVNRSPKKGNPILADSLVLKLGKDSEKKPADRNGYLHFFTIDDPFRMDNDNYSYSAYKDKDGYSGMYLYWNGDVNAFADGASTTASAFNGGYFALAGIGGLALGILGTTLVMLPRLRKKKEEEAA